MFDACCEVWAAQRREAIVLDLEDFLLGQEAALALEFKTPQQFRLG